MLTGAAISMSVPAMVARIKGYWQHDRRTGTRAGVVWSVPKKVPLQPWVTRVLQSTVYHASPMN